MNSNGTVTPARWRALLCSLAWNAGVAVCAAQSYATFTATNLDPRGVDAPIFDHAGNRLENGRYLAMIYGGSSSDSLAPVLEGLSGTLNPMPFGTGTQAGYFRNPSNSFVSSPSVASFDSHSWLQVRVWDSTLGNSYEAASAQGRGGIGSSPVFLALGKPWDDPLGVSQPLLGLQSFSLSAVVPEPETWALLGVGFTALAWFSRRRP